jgi:hypothetical protein
MNLLEQAKLERDRLNKVIALLEGTATTTTAKTAKSTKRHGHVWTAAEKKAMSLKQKAAWAKRRKKA